MVAIVFILQWSYISAKRRLKGNARCHTSVTSTAEYSLCLHIFFKYKIYHKMTPFCSDPFHPNIPAFIHKATLAAKNCARCKLFSLHNGAYSALCPIHGTIQQIPRIKKNGAGSGWLNANRETSMVDILPQAIYKELKSLFTIYIPLRCFCFIHLSPRQLSLRYSSLSNCENLKCLQQIRVYYVDNFVQLKKNGGQIVFC